MVSLKIDNAPVEMEFPIEFVLDGSEEFNLGVIKLVNLSKREAYPDYADIELTINGVEYEACIQRDISIRVAPDLYNHSITLAETVIKLKQYKMADRLYTTKSGSAITYKDQLENILLTQDLGKTSPFTIHADTQTLLNVTAVEKEYTGGDLLVTLMDIFRSVNAVPTLSLSNVIGHESFEELDTLITIGDIIGETITSDIADYGLGVYSKVKNGTYEKDQKIGWTYYPSKDSGVTIRSEEVKFNDSEGVFIIDSGIRRSEARIMNLELDTGAGSFFVEADISDYIMSKEEWDQLIVERTLATLTAGIYKNNTIYYTEGDNIIHNFGVKYENSNATSGGELVQEKIIETWLLANGYVWLDWVPQLVKEMEIRFYYQPMRDMDVQVERHNIERVTKRAIISNSQKDSKLELSRYGKALKSHINRVGNDSYEVTKTYNYLTSFTLWSLNDYTVDGYKIIKIHMLARENSMEVRYLFTKNASILNPLTAVDKSVNPFTITKRNILSCFVYNNYLEFSATSKTDVGLLSTAGKKGLLNGLKWDSAYDKPVYMAQFFSPSSSNVFYNMTATHFPLGTSMVFNVSFKHPKFAGYQLAADTGGVAGSKLVPVPYGDVNGEVSSFNLAFYNDLTSTPDTFPVGSAGSGVLINSESWSVGLNPDEMLGVSSIIHNITDRENLIIGDFFVENNSLMQVLGSQQGVTVSYYADTVKHTIYDRYRKSGSQGSGGYSIDAAYKQMTITGVPTGKSWAIHKTTAPYNIYMAYNYEDNDMNTIYINSLKDRPNIETL